MNRKIIYNGLIVNDNSKVNASVIIFEDKIFDIKSNLNLDEYTDYEVIDATGMYILPGIIDTHVHFREPGLTNKADIYTETRAAAAGGVTTFFDMPNTIPQATDLNSIEEKFKIASEKSLINYSFYIGATNNNINEILKLNPNEYAGIKFFYASSTGNMLVDKENVIEEIFEKAKVPVVIHSEDNSIINENYKKISQNFTDIPAEQHEFIRSAESCFVATKKLVELAKKHNTKVHFLHITTADETGLFESGDVKNKTITAEVSPNHIYFDSSQYKKLGMLIKCNPSIKNKLHKEVLIKALIENKIDSVATDHAPHLLEEKKVEYSKAPSGMPSIQHSLNIILQLVHSKQLTIEQVVEKMCHNPAEIFKISKRGFIQKGYYADLVLVDLNKTTTVKKEDLLYKCNWSPLEGEAFNSKIIKTIVNGQIVYDNGKINEKKSGQRIIFKR